MPAKAYCLIREQPWYRRSAFVTGLRSAGFEVRVAPPTEAIGRDDLLIIWNRYASNHDLALRFERAGGRVVVAENGYLGAGGGTPKFQVHPLGPKPDHYYALGFGFHNDDTRVIEGEGDRFSALRVDLKPWRAAGDHILVCPNRSFGVPGRSMPPDWAERCVARLKKTTSRPIRLRAHPGNNAPKRPLAEDLVGAYAVLIWSSSCGVHALAEGIPVFVEAPYWIMKGAQAHGSLESPTLSPRRAAFSRLAWAQWRCEEIEAGTPFAHLLSAARQG